MSYYDSYDDEYYEPDEKEMEVIDGMENTEVKEQGEKLVIEFNTENFAAGIVLAVEERLRKNLYKDIMNRFREEIFSSMEKQIMLSTHEIVKDMVLDFMENEKVAISSGSVWGDEEREELTLIQYSKRCIKECIEKGSFKVFTGIEKTPYGRNKYEMKYKIFTFEEYLEQNLGIGNEAKVYFDSEISKIRNQINADIKNAFDESTKTMLSQAVLQVLMANDTYKKIEQNIACIADKTDTD